MARVGGPLHSSMASGSISSGLCYDQHRGTAYVRNVPKGGRKRTTRQLQLRGNLRILHNAWRALTDTQRATWALYASTHPTNDIKFNRTVRITALNAFLALNSRRLMNGHAIVTDAPTIVAPIAPVGLNYVFQTFPIRRILLTWTTPASLNLYIEIWLHVHPSPVLHPDRRAYTWNKAGLSSLAFLEWQLPLTGTWYFFTRTQTKADGQVSVFMRNQVTVTPP